MLPITAPWRQVRAPQSQNRQAREEVLRLLDAGEGPDELELAPDSLQENGPVGANGIGKQLQGVAGHARRVDTVQGQHMLDALAPRDVQVREAVVELQHARPERRGREVEQQQIDTVMGALKEVLGDAPQTRLLSRPDLRASRAFGARRTRRAKTGRGLRLHLRDLGRAAPIQRVLLRVEQLRQHHELIVGPSAQAAGQHRCRLGGRRLGV
eukprot:CAMPEP_0176248440 /NCGR_PEP_ID=MMETSP0121_2-20121125/33467_1 /TAXON_ID=160619 /ORGANISM="Kryptoperidinium foliaceum, Strain CCMP 1326" /LENGTH=210 /DNA_ID=CAMNT_0017588117 /DNA_START=249 /DNA_END=882 /DNA_ORIENTATION=+